jgi:hypothetical protein
MALAPDKRNSILRALNMLRKFSSPQTLIHVGAGLGLGEMHAWQQWQIPNAWIIDASNSRLQWAEALASRNPGWHAVSAVLSEAEGSAEFHHTSNPDEDGLLAPELLATIWPNLKGKASEPVPLRRLDKLLETSGATTSGSWLFIDCLPALPVIKGAGKLLETCGAIWARTLLQPIDAVHDSAGIRSLEASLQPLGFHCIEIAEGNHPAVGHALFVRDWQAALQQLVKTNANLQLEKAALLSQCEALKNEVATIQAREECSMLAARRCTELEQASALKEQQAQLALEQAEVELAALRKQVAALTQMRDQHTGLAAEQQARIEQLAKARDEQTKLADQRKNELSQLQQKYQQNESRLAGLKADMAERDVRQQMLNDEMVRAEAQIDLIKDVLLRESGI